MFKDFCDFIVQLEQCGVLKCIQVLIFFVFEMIEVCDCMLCVKGLVLLFEKLIGFDMLVFGNLFGMLECVVLGMGVEDVGVLCEIGKLLV